MAESDVLRAELGTLGPEAGITSIRRRPGGYAADAWLVTYADGTRVVGKTLAHAPADLFRAEAEAEAEDLAALHATGHLSIPRSPRGDRVR